MAAGKEAQVIYEMRQKRLDGTFDKYPVGTEPRFISPIRQTNNGNLEEQLLLGYDEIITTNIDNDGTEHIHTCFTDDVFKTNYYILDSTIETIDSFFKHGDLAYLDGNTINFSHGIIELNDSALKDLKGNGFMVLQTNSDNTTKTLVLTTNFDKQVDVLKFKQSNGSVINVSKKTTTYSFSVDGAAIKKKVENLLT